MTETLESRLAREARDPASREKRLATLRRYRQSAKGKRTVAADAWKRRRLFPEQVRARNAVTTAVRYGHMDKPDRCDCGNPKVEAHHHLGYEPAHWLDVQWLCRDCHRREHGA